MALCAPIKAAVLIHAGGFHHSVYRNMIQPAHTTPNYCGQSFAILKPVAVARQLESCVANAADLTYGHWQHQTVLVLTADML